MIGKLDDAEAVALAREAYIWGFPLVQGRLYRKLVMDRVGAFNRLFISRNLSTPKTPAAPPQDVLYGVGWLDLAQEPLILSVPPASDRYYAIQLLDGFFNTIGYVGTRATGTAGGSFAIVGPDWQGRTPNLIPLRSPTDQVMLMSRTQVIDADDLPAALALQSGYALTPLSRLGGHDGSPTPIDDALTTLYPILPVSDLGPTYFDELGDALAEVAIPPADRDRVARFDAIGIGAGKAPARGGTDAQLAILAEAVQQGHAAIHAHPINTSGARLVNGWSVTYDITGHVSDPLDRAALGRFTPGAQVNRELLYFAQFNVDGTKDYRVHFPADGFPPVEGFWSLTMSGMDSFLVANPIDRYVLNSLTPGLRFEPDGALTVRIQAEIPAEGSCNWLPSPRAPFLLCLRAYIPTPEMLAGRYEPPPLIAA